MKKTALTLELILAFSIVLMVGAQFAGLAIANPMRGPYSPTETNKDPPKIIINSPTNPTYYQNIIPIRITVIQPDSWVTNQSDPNVRVVGPNSLRLVSCELDGESFTLWNGTRVQISGGNYAVSYYLPKNSVFSAMINVSSGKHTVRVNVQAVAKYYSPPTYPFPKKYKIATSQTVSFFVQAGSDVVWSPTIGYVETPVVPSPLDYFTYEGQFWFVPLIVILIAIAIGSGLGLLFYFIKRK